MRAGLSTIQQTLTPEASSVLNHSIAEAARRNHSQTTPLHVAATLLASPSGFLRQACIRSHPNSSHPLQCRALELCFSVALERLPSSQTLSPGLEPPISNALMAALKRAQAHQRRGCPEQQQQPLLAVKVELEQLIVSILDDPSVSRVMREASFSSPAVKATIEQSLNSSNSLSSPSVSAAGLGLKRNGLYVNPRLLQQGNCEQSGMQRREGVKRVVEIMTRSKKRNPVLVGDTEPELVMRDLLGRIEKREFGDEVLRNVEVVSLEKELASDRSKISAKMMELGGLVESRIGNNGGAGGGGLILDLGDLKWLVEQNVGFGVTGSGQQIVSDTTGRIAVVEMGKLLARFGGERGGRVWLIGTATCETYMRCQVYHPTMENDWDLQVLPIAARSPLPGMFPRLGGNGILSSSVESLTPLKGFPPVATTLPLRLHSENTDLARKTSCCPLCTENCEKELAKLKEMEKSCSDAKPESRPHLPAWLQIAKPSNGVAKVTDPQKTKDEEPIWKQKTEELKKKWNDTCYRLHHSSHSVPSITSIHNSNLLGRHQFTPKLQPLRNTNTLQMNTTLMPNPPERAFTPPGSPVRTDLLLGCPKVPENAVEKMHRERIIDSAGCIPSEWPDRFCDQRPRDKVVCSLDADSFKRLFKGLTEKVGWQSDAASAVATTVMECRSGNGKRRGPGLKGDTWLLFVGPDKVGKKKMASALSDLVFGAPPITVCLGSRADESDTGFRGKTPLDRIVEAVRRNPFSVVLLEEIDQADILVHGSIKRAIERGRLLDSHGREVGLGSVIFILTSDWLPDGLSTPPILEERLAAAAGCGWQLNLSVVNGKIGKRRAEWLNSDGRITKPRTDTSEAPSIDLNFAAEAEDDSAEGSRNSSDLTVERDHHPGLVVTRYTSSSAKDLFGSVDDAIVFKPVDFGPLRTKIASTISAKFAGIVSERRTIEIDSDALDRIVAGAWFGRTEFDKWVEKVLVPGFQQLKSGTPVDDDAVFRLVPVSDTQSKWDDFLPGKVSLVFEGM